jgi:hypothetical protein
MFWALISIIVSAGFEIPEVSGASWERLDFTFSSVSFVTVDPKDANIVYVGSSSGVFKTRDGGVSWQTLRMSNAPLSATTLVVASQRTTTLYAANPFVANGTGLFKSIDGGETWQAASSGLWGRISSLAIDPQNDDIVYAGQGCNEFGCTPLVFKSVNGGATWSNSANYLTDPACFWSVNDMEVDPTNSSIVYATTSDCNDQGGFFWKSVDGGFTWSAFRSPGRLFLNSTYYSPIVIDPQSPGTLYAGPQAVGVTKSEDRGENWVNVSSGLPLNFALSSLVIDPQFPNRLYATALVSLGVYRSTNAGASWTAVNDGLSNLAVYGLAISSGYPKTVYVATSNAVFKRVEDVVDSPHLGDLNADGRTDILWRNEDRNPVAWMMNGAVRNANTVLPSAPEGWSTSGLGDFNGDGRDDILRRSASGGVELWLMNGTNIASSTLIGTIWTGWTISGIGDFNGDSRADVLWRSMSGDIAIWLMDGSRIASFHNLGNVWTGWTISGVGDFNGDTRADILWRSASGDVAIWLMDGSRIASFHNSGNVWTGWTISGVGDFNGDTRADILWRSASGDMATWLMDGSRIESFHNLGNVWTGWTISGVGDFNGDNRSDILWQDATGTVVIWMMDGINVMEFNQVRG